MFSTWTTTAPAASPKRMQVPLSVQSTKRDKESAPITKTFLKPPPTKKKKRIVISTDSSYELLIILFDFIPLIWQAAETRPKTNPLQAAVISYAKGFFVQPSAFWICHQYRTNQHATFHSIKREINTCGAAPKRSSGVEVHIRTKSISSGATSAISRALVAASTAKPTKLSLPDTTRRLRIPVRVAIHSSLVSTIFARSSLEMRRLGTAEPDPISLQPLGASL